MNIQLQPESLSLVGNLRHLIVSTTEDVSISVKQQGATKDIVQRVYSPNGENVLEVDLFDIIFPELSFSLQNVSTPYRQTGIVKTFVVSLEGVTSGDTATVTFTAIRAGVDRLADTPQNFLQQNFLTWQPNVKPVTYYTPEFLTYYAVVASTVKCTARIDDSDVNVTLATIPAGQAYTVPVGYSVIAGKVNELPSYYDVWVENGSGQRLTYIQRYYANNMRSEQEQWILFENSLGGIDTFRAYGSLDLDAQHNHNLVEIEEISQEYRVDTERKYKKNTGRLDKKERLWLLDFFPSLRKYVYLDDYIRQIVVTESDVNYKAQELPSQYTFTYRFADAKPYLNLPRTDQPTGIVDIEVPDVGSFTIAPRLVEFPRLQLSSGALFPVQDPYSQDWNATTLGAVFAYFIEQILSQYDGHGGIGHMHPNLDFLDKLSPDFVRSLTQQFGSEFFLSKLNNDTAQGVITFVRGLISQAYTQFGQGADFGQFVQGLVGGDGARIDEHGNMEATSLVLRSFLEVPKLVYNHVDVRVGDEWQTNGAGEIESVEIDQNNPLQGTIKLRLLDGEFGTIKPQDKCKGIFHHLEGYNDTETKDDGKGGRTFAGFYTSYFVALSVSGNNNEYIRYELRPTIEVGGNLYWQNDQGSSSGIRGGFHPSAHMVFAQYSNAADNTRQSCQYRTTTYTRMLSGMTGWDEGIVNVAFQIGNTPLIASAYDIPDAGRYSLWINGDIYFAGTLNRVDSWGRDVADYPDQGNYFSTIQYHLNDLVHYDGSVWRMVIENEATIGTAPGTSTDIGGQTVYPWVKWIYADSMNPSGKWNHTLVPYAANSIVNIEGKLLISKRSTSQPPIDLLTDENSEPLQTETGEYIVNSDEVNDDWELLFDVGDLTNGQDGQNAIMVNLTNDTDTVLTDEQGNVIGDLPTTTAQLYDGVTLITSGVSWTCQTVGCTATVNSQGVVSITAMSADEAKVACIATYNAKTYTKVFTFKKLYGKDKLWLEPSVDKIERYVSGISDSQRSYAYAPTSIRFKAYIQKSGQEPRELTASDGYILLGTNTTHYASGQEINVASVANLFIGNHLPVLLKDASGNTQDVEDIVMTEAQDSITSAGAWTYERQIRNNELVSLFGNVYRAKQDSKGVSPVELLTNENNVPLQDEDGEYIAYNFNTNTTYYELWIKGSYVIRTEVMYAKGTDGTTTPTSGWSFTKPSVTYGDWLWIRTEVIRSDENNSVSYSVSYVGENAVQLALAVSPDAIALNADGNFKTGDTLTVKIQKTEGSVTTNIQKSSTATFKLWVGSNGYGISDYNSSTKSYSISLTGKNIQPDSYVHITYVDGDINLDKSVSITQDGSQGLQGCVTRVSEWKAGITYKHDAGLALGYIDVVGVRNSSVATGWDFYECKTEHTASTSNQPPNTTYWTKLNNLGATYTSLLIADNAFIRFGATNQFVVVNSSNNQIEAGMKGSGDIRFWAGGGVTYDANNQPTDINLNNANFRVKKDGSLYAKNSYIEGEIHAKSGEFTGTITAKQGGNIGGFKVDYNLSLYAFSDGLDAGSRHNGYVDSLTIKPSGVTLTRGLYNNSTTISALQSFITIGPAAELSGDYHGNVRIVNRHSDASWPLLVNFGIYLDVQGARNWDDNPTYGNHALFIAKGNIAGFRKETRRVGSSQTLSIYDNNVICTKENITLTLPNAPEDGQEYTIIPYGRVYVAASGSDKIRYPNGASYTTATFDDYKHHWLIYDSVNKLWLADWGG